LLRTEKKIERSRHDGRSNLPTPHQPAWPWWSVIRQGASTQWPSTDHASGPNALIPNGDASYGDHRGGLAHGADRAAWIRAARRMRCFMDPILSLSQLLYPTRISLPTDKLSVSAVVTPLFAGADLDAPSGWGSPERASTGEIRPTRRVAR